MKTSRYDLYYSEKGWPWHYDIPNRSAILPLANHWKLIADNEDNDKLSLFTNYYVPLKIDFDKDNKSYSKIMKLWKEFEVFQKAIKLQHKRELPTSKRAEKIPYFGNKIKLRFFSNGYFRINMPYGIFCNNEDQWIPFNREYLPLFISDPNAKTLDLKVITKGDFYPKFKGLTEELLVELSQGKIERDINLKITRIWFYNDATNPYNVSVEKRSGLMNAYYDKLEILVKYFIYPTIE